MVGSNTFKIVKSVLSSVMADRNMTGGINSQAISAFAYNNESADSSTLELGKAGYENLANSISMKIDAINSESVDNPSMFITETQKRAAISAATMVTDVNGFKAALNSSYKNASAVGSDVVTANLEGIGSSGIDANQVLESLNQEAFDGQVLDTVYYTTIALAVATSKQDDFAEAFFPLVVMSPTDAFYEVKIDIDSFSTELRHLTPHGVHTEFVEKEVLKHLNDNKLLNDNKFKLYPLVENDAEKKFLVEAAKYGVEVAGNTLNVAPYKTGVSLDIFALSNSKKDAAKGNVPDFTDALDRAIRVTKIYFPYGTDKFITVDTTNMTRGLFNLPPEGNNKELELNFPLDLVFNSKAVDKVDSTNGSLHAIAGTKEYEIKVRGRLTGSVQVDTGVINVSTSSFEFVEAINVKDKTKITDLTSEAEVKKFVEELKVAGYDLDVAVTNSNFRRRGLKLTNRSFRVRYNCEFRNGVIIDKPIFDLTGKDNDAAAATVERQGVAISAMMSVAAVNTLVDFSDYLHARKEAGTLASTSTRTLATKMVNPWYHRETINVKDIVDSLRSTDRRDDIAAAIINKIRDAATIMSVMSNYGVIFERLCSGAKKTVLIGTDTYIANYLGAQLQAAANSTVSSSKFPLSHDTDAVIVSTNNELMAGKIIVTFTYYEDPNKNQSPHPLSFGCGLYTPPFNREVQVTRNGATIKELHVDPRFSYIPNLPIMAQFDVQGLQEAISKNVQWHKVVS